MLPADACNRMMRPLVSEHDAIRTGAANALQAALLVHPEVVDNVITDLLSEYVSSYKPDSSRLHRSSYLK